MRPPPQCIDLKNLDPDEISGMFENYDFKDKQGHSLTNCVYFQQLIQNTNYFSLLKCQKMLLLLQK
jgi:hypothetical protein